jgi:hypothetical protein
MGNDNFDPYPRQFAGMPISVSDSYISRNEARARGLDHAENFGTLRRVEGEPEEARRASVEIQKTLVITFVGDGVDFLKRALQDARAELSGRRNSRGWSDGDGQEELYLWIKELESRL